MGPYHIVVVDCLKEDIIEGSLVVKAASKEAVNLHLSDAKVVAIYLHAALSFILISILVYFREAASLFP